MLIDRLGRGRSAHGAVLVITPGAGLIGAANSAHTLLPLGVFWGIAWGFQETIFVALATALFDARIAASRFAIMMALSNTGTAVGEGVATGLTDNIGFSNVFLLMAGLNLLVLLILWGMFQAMSKPESAQQDADQWRDRCRQSNNRPCLTSCCGS